MEDKRELQSQTPQLEYDARRTTRIQAHIEEAIGNENTLQSVLMAASGDMMLIQYNLAQAILARQQQVNSPATMGEVLPVVATHAKLSQQIDRYVQLAVKLNDQASNAESK